MKLKAAAAAMVALSSIFALSACGTAQAPQQSQQVEAQVPAKSAAQIASEKSVLASYELGGSQVTEFRSVSDPGSIVIAFDGYQSSGIAKWKDTGAAVGKPQILAQYENSAGTIVEFKPAANKDINCVYVDAYKSGSLTCGL